MSMRWFSNNNLNWFCAGMLVERIGAFLAPIVRRAWHKARNWKKRKQTEIVR